MKEQIRILFYETAARGRSLLGPGAPTCCEDLQAPPMRRRSFRLAMLALTRRRDCTDGIRLDDHNEHHEAQCCDADVQTLITSFMLAPMHLPVRADGVHQLTDDFAIREPSEFRKHCR